MLDLAATKELVLREVGKCPMRGCYVAEAIGLAPGNSPHVTDERVRPALYALLKEKALAYDPATCVYSVPKEEAAHV